MAIVQGNWAKLLAPGLAALGAKCYYEPEYDHLIVVTSNGSKMAFSKEFLEDSMNPYEQLGQFIYASALQNIQELAKFQSVPILHVYDLGDGMLVPCALVHELFSNSKFAGYTDDFGLSSAEAWLGAAEYLDPPHVELKPPTPKQVTKKSIDHFKKIVGKHVDVWTVDF